MRDALRLMAERQGDKVAVISADGARSLDYRSLDRAADRVAGALRGREAGDGDTIALLCDNSIDVACLWWGARRAGLYYVPLPVTWTADEIAQVLGICGARLLIHSHRHGDTAAAAVVMAGGRKIDLETAETVLASESGPIDPPPLVVGRELMFSSGTTGRPKGIRRPLAPVSAVFDLPDLERRMRKLFHIGPDTIYLSAAPLYHATGRFVMRVLEEGGTVVILPAFDAEEALAAIERHRITNTQWVPTMFVRLLALRQQDRARFDLSSLRHALHAAAPCPPAVKRAMIEWWGPIVDEYYGGTENAGVTFIDAREWLDRPGSVGRSITGSIHILDEADHDRELAAGEIGQITFEGGVPFAYIEDGSLPRADAVESDRRGYGDLGHVDADGFLYISDRRSDLIVTGGVNVYPREVELVLEQHSGVSEAAVIGVPDDEFGQQVRAVVVARAGVELDAEDIDAFVRPRLARVKQPRSVRFVDALPRNENGKLLKRVLRDWFADDPR